MTTYRTGNPVGSPDPRDLYDNAENLDNAANSDNTTWTDRLGESRRTIAGIEQDAIAAIQNAGYVGTGTDNAVEDYAAGIEITQYNQIVRDGGEFWRVSGSETLPYTTTGAGVPEGGALVSVGDAALRQDLAKDPSTGQGALLVRGATVYVGSVAELEALSLPAGTSVTLTMYGKGGPGTIRAGTPPVDPLKGIYIPIANGNYWYRDNAEESADLRWFDAVLDGIADDTEALRSAIALRSTIRGFEGNCRFTETIVLGQTTRLEAANNKSSGNGFFTRYTFDPSDTVSESTLASSITDSATNIDLESASGFPASGYVRIGTTFDNEYVKYTGVSGNTLTGCSRGWFGGTQGPTIVTPGVDNQGTAQTSGTTVTQVQNAFELDGVFAGEFGAVIIKHAKGTRSPNVPGVGNALYLTYTAYSKCINGTSFRNFERCVYSGRSYVTTIVEPVFYFCYIGAQIDIGNGASIKSGDSGRVGSGTEAVEGQVWVFRGGDGPTVWGGNYGNGEINVPFTADNCRGLTIVGAYIESAKRENLVAKNQGSIIWTGGFIKEGYYLGRVESGGRIVVKDVVTRDIAYISGLTFNVIDGSAESQNHYDYDFGDYKPDVVNVNNREVKHENPLANINKAFKKPSIVTKTLTAGATTSFLSVRDVVNSTDVNSGGVLSITYSARAVGSRSATEIGSLLVAFTHRYTLPLSVDVQKGADTAKALSNSGTLTVAFANTIPSGPSDSDQTFDLQVTATPDETQPIEFICEYKLLPNVSDQITVTEV